MGDLVIATYLIDNLIRNRPDVELYLLTKKQFTGLFAHDSRFKAIISPKLSGHSLLDAFRFAKSLLGTGADLVIDLQANQRSRFLLGLCRLLKGGRLTILGPYAQWPYSLFTGSREPYLHPHDYHRDILKQLGLTEMTRSPALLPGADELQSAAQKMAEHGLVSGSFAVLLPGSQAAGWLKRWGAERYAALARLLLERGLDKVVLLGGPDELDECSRIESLCAAGWLINLCGKTRILELVPLCAAARLIVGNDTGTAHVASSTGTPLVVICGPTNPRRVKPVGDQVRTLQAELDCINCYGKECDHHSCMSQVTPQMVVDVLADVLK
jgi:heptosyltransferase-2